MPHNHGLLLLKNTFKFHVFKKNEKNECFINKYLLIDQTMFSMKICNMQIHHCRKTREKNVNQFTNFNIQSTNEIYENITLFTPLYHSTKSFQFINTCQ